MKEAVETYSKLLVEGSEGSSVDNPVMDRYKDTMYIPFLLMGIKDAQVLNSSPCTSCKLLQQT